MILSGCRILVLSFELLLLLLNIRPIRMKCIHDEVVVNPTPSTSTHSEGTRLPETPWSRRNGRSLEEGKDEFNFKPLRIHVHHSPSSVLDRDTQIMLELAVKFAVMKISTVLSVVPVHGRLLLSRSDACPIVFRSGINKGKCSRLRKGYRGEFCLDIFRIPEDHLEGISIYNATHREPVRNVSKAGPGVDGADVILYVAAKSTKLCLAHNQSVIAYAIHCRVDQTGRPIAGLVNFCPFTLVRSSSTQDLLYSTALHEILHVLGFSTKLFKKFRECKGGSCKTASAPVRSVNGQRRLATPAVVNKTQRHFNCYTQDDFGGPLEMIVACHDRYISVEITDKGTSECVLLTEVFSHQRGHTSQNSKETSHWDSRIMHTSLMTARDDNTSSVVLDPITLAVFEDSGWYEVNYTNADQFLWGKDSGCLFGLPDQCLSDKKHFCFDNSSGCHFLLRYKATCDALKTGSQCGVFVPDVEGSCTKEIHHHADELNTLEVFSASSRCFVSSVTSPTSHGSHKGFTGQCYDSWCAENGTVFVKLRSTDWMQCPLGQTIQVSGLQGEIQCPESTEMTCGESGNHMLLTTSTPHNEGTTSWMQETKTRSRTSLAHTTARIISSADNGPHTSLTCLMLAILLTALDFNPLIILPVESF